MFKGASSGSFRILEHNISGTNPSRSTTRGLGGGAHIGLRTSSVRIRKLNAIEAAKAEIQNGDPRAERAPHSKMRDGT